MDFRCPPEDASLPHNASAIGECRGSRGKGCQVCVRANMNWIVVSLFCLAPVLSACAGTGASNTEAVKTGLPRSESFRIQRSQSSDYDYLVSIKNGRDLGINADDQAARDRMALLALKDQCEAPQIVKEMVVHAGTEMFGNAERTYELQVKC